MAILMACLSQSADMAQNADQSFDAANRLYEQGKFAEASSGYDKLIGSGHYSTALLFNSGNAFYKQGQLGRAIADYRKAQLIEPREPSVQKNLLLARSKARGGTVYAPPIWLRVVSVFSLNVWTVLVSFFGWAFFILLGVGFLKPNVKNRLRNPIYLSVALALLFGVGFLIKYSDETKASAIVITGETDVRNGPLDEAPSVFKVRDGAELEVHDRKDDWFQVSDSSDRMGWIRKDQVIIFRAADGLGHGTRG